MHDGCGGMEDMQHMHMVFVLFFRDRRTQFANRIKYPDRTVLVKQWLVIRANVRHDVIFAHHVFWHCGHERGVAAEDHDIDKIPAWEFQPFRQHVNVPPVLLDGILEPVLLRTSKPSTAARIERLCPETIFGIGEYPALVAFGFNDKQPKAGDDHVIDLRRYASRVRYHQIVQHEVFVRGEPVQFPGDFIFTFLTDTFRRR